MKKDKIPWYSFLLGTGTFDGIKGLFVWCQGDYAYDTDKKSEAVMHEVRTNLSWGKHSAAKVCITMGFEDIKKANSRDLLELARQLNTLAEEHATKVVWKFGDEEVRQILADFPEEFTLEDSFALTAKMEKAKKQEALA